MEEARVTTALLYRADIVAADWSMAFPGETTVFGTCEPVLNELTTNNNHNHTDHTNQRTLWV